MLKCTIASSSLSPLHLAGRRKQRRILQCRAQAINVEDRVLVVGGGVGGLATAVALTKNNIPVTVLERSETLREEGASIGFLANAWRALEALGIADDLRGVSPRCLRAQFWTAEGRKLGGFALDDQEGNAEMRGVLRRRVLNRLAAELPSDCIQFKSNVQSIDLSNSKRPLLTLENGKQLQARVVIAADGARSRVAGALGLASPMYQGYCGMRSISVFDEPPIPPQTIYYYMGEGIRSGMFQVEQENKIYWFLVFNSPKRVRMETTNDVIRKAKEISLKFDEPVQACVRSILPLSVNGFLQLLSRLNNPFRPIGKGTVTVLGDAFHPMTPNLGQGGALALEDAVVLGRRLSIAGGLNASDDRIIEDLRGYESERLTRANVVTLRSRFVGSTLSNPFPPVVAARNTVFANFNLKPVYLSTAGYDCGSLHRR